MTDTSDTTAASADTSVTVVPNDCSFCGAVMNAGPEGDRWYGGHCWQCGYREGQQVAAAQAAAAGSRIAESHIGDMIEERLRKILGDRGVA